MSMVFPYKQFNLGRPIIPLDGRSYRSRPIIPITIIGPTDERPVHGLLDTGADDVVFPDHIAASIGLDLTNAPTGSAGGVSTGTATLRYAQVTLQLTDGNEIHTWQAWVAFTSTPLRTPLLGISGLLRFFEATFQGDCEQVVLEPNALFPSG
jgi:predicted aspartyl protease